MKINSNSEVFSIFKNTFHRKHNNVSKAQNFIIEHFCER